MRAPCGRIARRYLTVFIIEMMGLIVMTSPTFGNEKDDPRAAVVEPFLEIHTGPGRSYPVFYIAEKGEEILLIKRRTDWFKVRLLRGQVGWVHRHEIDLTIRGSGYLKSWGDSIYDDYVENHLALGWGWGTFEKDNVLYVRINYLLNEVLSVEGNVGFASGDLGETNLYLGGLVMTPWKGSWFSLNGTLGGGLIETSPASLLVNVEKDSFPAAYAGVGFSAPLFRRLSIRGDFRNMTLFIDPKQIQEIQEYSLGVIFNF